MTDRCRLCGTIVAEIDPASLCQTCRLQDFFVIVNNQESSPDYGKIAGIKEQWSEDITSDTIVFNDPTAAEVYRTEFDPTGSAVERATTYLHNGQWYWYYSVLHYTDYGPEMQVYLLNEKMKRIMNQQECASAKTQIRWFFEMMDEHAEDVELESGNIYEDDDDGWNRVKDGDWNYDEDDC